MVDAKYVIGLLVGFFGIGFVLNHTLGALIAPGETAWVLGRWKPLLNKVIQQSPPATRQRVHQELAKDPQAAQMFRQAGINW